MRTIGSLLLVVAALYAAPLEAAGIRARVAVHAATPSLTTLSNQSYGAASIRKYDLYYPNLPDLNNRPILIWIHGGGWTGLDKADADKVGALQALAKAGFIVYSINYTLAAGTAPTRFPVQIQDIKTLLSFIAEGLGTGDAQRISLWGYSAGGHLALVTALTPASTFTDATDHTSTAYTIKSVAGGSPPTDLESLYAISATCVSVCPVLLGYVPSTNSAGALAASPSGYVAATSIALQLQGGTADVGVPDSQNTDLITAFAGVGVTVGHLLYTGYAHTDADYFAATGTAFRDTFNFLLAHGR